MTIALPLPLMWMFLKMLLGVFALSVAAATGGLARDMPDFNSKGFWGRWNEPRYIWPLIISTISMMMAIMI